MADLQIQFHNGGVRLPELGLWLDAHDPQLGPERVFISHAHSDHVEAHREIILSAPTAKLMAARFGGQGSQHVLRYGEPASFEYGGTNFRITLLPAGHIFGSAMSWIEARNQSLLYTGDFKLRRGLSAETCEPRRANILIMETTFGRPEYVFLPADAVVKAVVRFCREALANDETPVLLGYSLGKSQEVLCGLGDAGLPLMLHGAVFKLTQIYEQFGQCFPKYERYESGSARGKVLLCPPQVINSAMLRNLGKTRTAIMTGWAVDPNCRFRYGCDAAFPLSDHADFPQLIELVKRVQPNKVFTLHGFAADFARALRQVGFDAQALSENEQLHLGIDLPAGGSPGRKSKFVSVSATGKADPGVPAVATVTRPLYRAFCETCSEIAGTTSKLQKVRILSEYLRLLNSPDVATATTWFSGRPFPSSHGKVLQLGWAVLRDALCASANVDEATVHRVYMKHSDLGETAEEILATKSGDPPLMLDEVRRLFDRLHAVRGPLAKTPLLIEAFDRCSPMEAKYLVKVITGDLRIGLKEGLVEDAVAAAFGKPLEEIRQAHLLLGDIGEVAAKSAEGNLATAALVPFRPIKFMLASPEPTAAAVWDRIAALSADASQAEGASAWLEDKYDGVRCQLHKVGRRAALYSRDLKDITMTFPELADAAAQTTGDFILDGEIVAMRGDAILPFADLQKRLGRRGDDMFLREEVPVKFIAFDLLWQDQQSTLDLPLRERRRRLDALALPSSAFRLAQITPARSAEDIDAAFDAARARGNEGLMIKDPASTYLPGRRGLAWLKLKKALATLDCVVVGVEYGHGKRNKVLSDYTFAVRDDHTGELKTIGKAYSGLTDAEIARLTEHFLKHAIQQRGRYFEVEPDTVVEIAFDKIQPSDRHSSGLAMRFPRIARIRTDKTVAEIDTVGTARKMAGGKF